MVIVRTGQLVPTDTRQSTGTAYIPPAFMRTAKLGSPLERICVLETLPSLSTVIFRSPVKLLAVPWSGDSSAGPCATGPCAT